MLQTQYTQVEQDHSDLSKEIRALQEIIQDSADTNRTLAKQQTLQRACDDCQQLLHEMRGYQYICDEVARQADRLKNLQIEYETLSDQVQLQYEKWRAISGEVDQLHHDKKALDQQYDGFVPMAKMLNKAHASVAAQNISESDDGLTQRLITLSLTTDHVVELLEQSHHLRQSISEFIKGFTGFIREIKVQDVDPYVELHRLEECGVILSQCNNMFETLQYQKVSHEKHIAAHNQYLNNMIQELENAHKILHGTIHEMNQTLEARPVSNFASVRMRLKIRADFENLLDNCKKHDISEHTLMEGEFYTMLLNYVKEHFNNQTKRIKMVDLIDTIHYEYIGHDGSIDTKAQSGGTTSTVTSFIISLLLNKILMADHALRIPVVIDEIADIDGNNMKMIVEQITQSGFSIFCATPTFAPIVCQYIGNYVLIDSSHLKTERYVDKCTLHIMPNHINRVGMIDDES